MSKTSIHDFWPMQGKSPRASQITALDWIEGLPSHIKYIILEIPVGGGKSPIALNMSAWMANSFGSGVIMTPQKILQRQYEESFDSKYLASMYGKVNYECKPRKTNCDIGSAVKPKCESCPYRGAYARAKHAPNVVLNYKLALLYSLVGLKIVQDRKIIVFDECHTLENHLTEFLAPSVSERGCKKLGVKWQYMKEMPQALYFLQERYLPAVSDRLVNLSALVKRIEEKSFGIDGVNMSDKDIEVVKEYKELAEHFSVLETISKTPFDTLIHQYVYVPEKTTFKFKEVYGARVFAELLEPLADRFLFMSSTVLDKEGFCSDLGLDPSRAAFMSLESEFDKDNRQVIYMPTAKMTQGWDSQENGDARKAMIDTIVHLCTDPDHHKDHSGVIHTGSFLVADWLVRELKGKVPQKILEHGPNSGRTRDQVIDEFTNGQGGLKLLISPSVTEGLDLKDDLARFNIIAKVPYPYLGDAWVRRRMELSSSWYNRQAMISIIQACGRTVRTPTDWSYTYILDSSFEGLYRRVANYTPKWWKSAFVKL